MLLLAPMLAVALLAAGTIAPAATKDRSPEAKLARALAGRVAGKPVDCLQLSNIRSSQIISDTAILYETTGGIVYLNTPRSGASSLNENQILVTDTRSSRLCSIDIVRLYDQGTRAQTGFVGLGPFVPYTRPRNDGQR